MAPTASSNKVVDSPANRRRGWRRMSLFGLVFLPSGIAVGDFLQAFRQLPQVSPATRALGSGAVPFDGGLYLVRNYCFYYHRDYVKEKKKIIKVGKK